MKQLLAHFDRISDAPDAIPRLRQFILDLAVRGKLVEPDPNDEPASALLKRIQIEKARILKQGGLRQEKPKPDLADEDLPFPIRDHWRWSQLAEIGFLNPRNSAEDGLLASFVPMPLVSAVYGVPNTHEVRPWAEMKNGYTHFAEGDVALAKITPCFENGKSTVFRRLSGGIGAGTTELHVVRPVIAVAEYVLIFLKSPHFIQSGIPKMTGTAGQKRVPTDYFAYSPFPLPPLAEQHRIVAKVDELMSLCDRLEAAQAERETRRDRLSAASLHRLNQPADPEAPEVIRAHARFYLTHLPRLTTRPDQIKHLRQTILNLAVRGQLAGPVRSPYHTEPLHAVARLQNGYAFKSEWFAKTGIRLLRNANVSHGVLRWDELACLPNDLAKEFDRFQLNEGDVVFSLDRPFIVTGTKAARVRPNDLPCLLLQRVGRFQLNTQRLSADYLFLWLQSPHFSDQIDPGRSNGVPHVSSQQVEASEIFVPPLAEQHRIVAKVDELMSLCDQLEAHLTTTQSESRRLLEAVLHEALDAPAVP